MSSLVAFFHKHMNFPNNRFKAANRMRKSIRRIQKITRQNWFPCDKCGELLKKEELEHVEEINEDFCKTCIDMMKLARGDY